MSVTVKAKDLKPGDTVTRPATAKGEPPRVTRTVKTVSPLPPGTDGVRVIFTDGMTMLYPSNNEV